MGTKNIKINWKKFTSLFSRDDLDLKGFYYFKVKGRNITLHKCIVKKAYLRSFKLIIGKMLFKGTAELSKKMKPTSGFIQYHKGNILPAGKIKGKLNKKVRLALLGFLSNKKVMKHELI